MFGHPLYVWMPQYALILPCMFGHPNVWMPPEYMWTLSYVWMLPYVWEMFGCLLYIYNTKKACFVRLRGCPYAPHTFGYPHVWMSLYVWSPPCLDVPHTFGYHHTFGSFQTYRGQPNIWRASKHKGGCPNMGHPTIQRGVQT